MNKLSFSEKRKIISKRKNLGINIGVLDRGLYYLTAIVLKDIELSGVIVINKHRRDFLNRICNISYTNTLYKYLLKKIIEYSTLVESWKKWVTAFLVEYQNRIDLITSEEVIYSHNILEYQNELIAGIYVCDSEEEYMDIIQLERAFDIKEMIEAVEIVLSRCSCLEENSRSESS